MIKIYKVFFCDSISHAQFGKLNFHGLIPGKSISVTKVPYNFISNLIILGESDELPKGIVIKIEFYNLSGSNTNTQTIDLTKELERTVTGNPPYQIFLIVGYQILVDMLCSFKLSIFKKEELLFEENFCFEIGDAQEINFKKDIPLNKIFSGSEIEDISYVKDIVNQATISIKIFDTYLDSKNLNELLSNTSKNLFVQILTSASSKKSIGTEKLLESFPNIEIRSSKNLHDRFLVINDSEYYHFGHSLKDVVSNKVSRASKIINKVEIENLKDLFQDIWNKAEK